MFRTIFTPVLQFCKTQGRNYTRRTMSEMAKDNSNNIRNHLEKIGNGAVILNKNEENGVATLTLQNSEKKNAINGKVMVELRDRIEELESWETGKAVIIKGSDDNFCSGADLDFVREINTKERAIHMTSWMQETLTRLQNLPLVSVAFLEGFAIGGGAELAVSCDYIIMTENTKFGFVHAKMGLIPIWGGTTRLVRKIGHRKALDILLTGKVFRAADCLNIGLADAIVPTSESFAKTMEWLNPRIQHHHTIVRANKINVTHATDASYHENLENDKKFFLPFWGGKLQLVALNKKIKHHV